jgi:transcriptional regulator with XRE-family HTH domain
LNDKEITARLKFIRQSLGLNQNQIADILKIDRTYWSALERGKREITGKIFKRLFVTLSISADWLISGAGTMKKTELSPEAIQKAIGMCQADLDKWYKSIVKVLELREKEFGHDKEYETYLDKLAARVSEYTNEMFTDNPNAPKQYHLVNIYPKLKQSFIDDFAELVENFHFDVTHPAIIRKFVPPKNVVK